jgi:hypothetical protein
LSWSIFVCLSRTIEVLRITTTTIAARSLRWRRVWKDFLDCLLNLFARRRLIECITTQSVSQRHHGNPFNVVFGDCLSPLERSECACRSHDR